MVDEVRDERPRPWAWFDHDIIDHYAASIGPMGVTVYMALLRFCGNSQTCYPSSETLEQRLGLSHQSIWRATQKLIEAKLISVERRLSGPKGRASNVYTIHRPSNPPAPCDHEFVPNRNKPKLVKNHDKPEVCSPQEQTEGEVCSPQEQTVCSPQEQEVDTKRRSKKDTTTRTSSAHHDRFDAFWHAYPKKQAKGRAWKIWSRLKPTEALLESMLAAISIQRTSIDWQKEQGKYIPFPAKWLDEQRWDDVAYIPPQPKRSFVE